MKFLNFLLGLLLLFGCTEPVKNEIKPIGNIQEDNSTSTATKYAEGLIKGEIQPADNDQTYEWLKNLQSDNKATRDLAFKVYKAICLKSDGALSEGICGHIKSYFQIFPREFLDNYPTLDDKKKNQTLENLAFEFFASGHEYKTDIEAYFLQITARCKTCENDINFNAIKSGIERLAGEMND